MEHRRSEDDTHLLMESGLGWKVALASGPFIGVLLMAEALVPMPGVAGISASAVTGAGQ